MINFGTSAFLKLINLNPRPQRTELRKRVVRKGGRAFDFHNRTRRLCGNLALNRISYAEAISRAEQINAEPERNSAITGLDRINQWLTESGFIITRSHSASIYESPNSRFRFRFDPLFAINRGSDEIFVYVWNNIDPALDPRMTAMALRLAEHSYEIDRPPGDVAVLDLRTLRLISLSQHSSINFSQAEALASRIDQVINEIEDDLLDRPSEGEERPTPL